MTQASPTAAVLIIGDEVLSGRTQDTNLNTIARFLGALGIELMEARTVGDRTGQIVEALDALRAGHDYVFTTGGIGPTHDDITADAVAQAFGVALLEHPDALAILEKRYGPGEFNAARRRMAGWRRSPSPRGCGRRMRRMCRSPCRWWMARCSIAPMR